MFWVIMAAPKRRKVQGRCHPYEVSNMEEEIEAIFNKKFVLKSSEEIWTLPDACSLFTGDPFVIKEMIEMKHELNRIKGLLNDMDIGQWHLHTRRVNKAGQVVKHLREKIRVEMCTQAWAKFYEVLNSFDLIPKEALRVKRFRSVHLCEAPGAFIASLNHFLKSHYSDLEWRWIGTTLNPYYEGHDLKAMLDDDRFILETLPQWNFGADRTGDLMNRENLTALQAAASDAHLVTADGSIDCADQPAEQENLVAQLIFCEVVAFINLLSKGGNCVFKMFTAFEHQMICLLYLVSCLFKEVHVIKPGTSKSGNSEVYIACLGFFGKDLIPENVYQKLKSAYSPEPSKRSLFPLSCLPSDFLERLTLCEKFFAGLQTEAINLHIRQFYYISQSEKQYLVHLRQHVVHQFVEKFHLQPIRKEDHIVTASYLDGTQLSFTRGPTNNVPFSESFSGRQQIGSYNERQNNLGQSWLAKLEADGRFHFDPARWKCLRGVSQANNGTQLIPLFSDQVTWLQKSDSITPDELIQGWKMKIGLPVANVLNSRFCTPFYISKLREAREQIQMLKREHSERLQAILDKVHPSNLVKKMTISVAELRNLDTLVKFTEMAQSNSIAVVLSNSESLHRCAGYLQEQNVRFKSICLDALWESGQPVLTPGQNGVTVTNYKDILQSIKSMVDAHGQAINLVFVDLSLGQSTSHGQEELILKTTFVYFCTVALRILKTGGMLVCRIFDTLTRFTVGILCILHQLFQETTIVKPVISQLYSPERYLVCKGFVENGKHLITFLESILDQLEKVNSYPRKLSCDVLEIVPMRELYREPFYFFVKKANEQLAHLQLQTIVQIENCFLFPEKIPSVPEVSYLEEDIMKYLNL